MRLKNYLINEALINMEKSDIQMIYRPISKWVEMYHNAFESRDIRDKIVGKIDKMKTVEVSDDKVKHIETMKGENFIKKVKSDTLKEAYEKNPLNKIVYGFCIDGGSFYDPVDEMIAILIDLTPLMNYWSEEDEDKRKIYSYQASRSESKNSLLSSIRHELSHYADNSLHGKFATKFMKRARKELSKGNPDKAWKIFSQFKEDPYLGSFETNAIVNQIDEFKRIFKDKWDEMTIEDLFRELNMAMYVEEYGDKFLKPLLKRLYKENLLGKQMKKDMKNFKVKEIEL